MHTTNNIFQLRDNLRYNLRSQTEFLRSSANTSQYGLDSLGVFSSKVWNMVPTEIKNSATLNIFKENYFQNIHSEYWRNTFRILDIQILSEFNFSCFEKPIPLSTNVPASANVPNFMLSVFLVIHVEV